jgi:hypothetical protein
MVRSKAWARWLGVAAVLTIAPLASPAAASVAHAPLQRLGPTSENWAGYYSTAGPFASVSASWVQPAATCTSEAMYSAFWVGLDGANDDTVEQTGSEVDCIGGTPKYYAWYEMYPSKGANFPGIVMPGDQFSASVAVVGTKFTLTITDLTRHWHYKIIKTSKTATKASAEIIVEAPSRGGTILPLTDFGTVSFTSAEANGESIALENPEEFTMVARNHTVKATPSALSGDDFSVVWDHS